MNQSLISQEILSELINKIYNAIQDISHWQELIDEIVAQLGCNSGSLLYAPAAGQYQVVSYSNIPDEAIQRYNEKYAEMDPLMSYMFSRVNPGEAVHDQDIFPDREALEQEHAEFFKDFLYQYDIYHAGGINISTPGGPGALILQRTRDQGPLVNGELQVLKLLAPHFMRAFSLHDKIVFLEALSAILHEGIGRAGLSIFALDEHGTPLFINKAGHRLLKESQILSISEQRFKCNNRESTEKLLALIQHATTGDQKQATGMRLTQADITLDVTVTPYLQPEDIQWPFIRDIAALMLIGEPGKRRDTQYALMQQLYGLSAAEAKLLAQLIQGESLEQAASHLNVSIHTVRSQMKSILKKTHTRRQAEVISTVLNGPIRFIFNIESNAAE